MMRCDLCGKSTNKLQLIESIFPYDAVEVAAFLSRPEGSVGGELGTDTLTVCPGNCADEICFHSLTIIRDGPFEEVK